MNENKTSLVVLDNNYQIANKQMKTQLKKVVEGLEMVEKGTWKFALGIHQIIVKELYVDDFKTLDELASYLGTSKSYLSKCYNACEYALNNNVLEKISVNKAYLLSSIKNMETFKEYCEENSIDYENASIHQLEEIIKSYNNRNANAIKEEAPQKEEEAVEIHFNRKKYIIPVKVLNKYLVEE